MVTETSTESTANIDGVTYVQVEPSCYYCGLYHEGICPRVEEIEYHPNGTVKRVRLREAQQDFPLREPPPDPLGELGHTCGVDCPQTVWGG